MAQPRMTGAVAHPLVQAIMTYQQAMATGDFGKLMTETTGSYAIDAFFAA